jgi:hypothetical protein
MPDHNLIGEYKGKISILKRRYGELSIEEDEIMQYITAILHEHLKMKHVEAIIAKPGSIHGGFQLIKDEADPNGLYKIYKPNRGFIIDGTPELVARFWIDSSEKDIKPRDFIMNTA